MSTLSTITRMTVEELFAMPEDGVERDLVRGQLREKPMTRRNPRHSETEITIGHLLAAWLERQPHPRGAVLGGEAGFVLGRNPDSSVGIDVAYISAELAQATPDDARFVEGVPVLAVEILSPSDKQEDILEKVKLYLEVGVALVWVVEPVFRTVTVYRAARADAMFNTEDELSADPHLPGFRVAVADLFRR